MFRVTLWLTLAALAFTACNGNDSTNQQGSPPGADEGPERLIVESTVTLLGRDPDDAAAGMAAGDFNGDGNVDIVLGAAFADGPGNTREDSGEVLVFLGPFQPGETRDGGAGAVDVVIDGADPGDQAGRAVGVADLNGDGIDDVVIGAPFADGPGDDRENAGEAVVVLGSALMGADVSEIDLRDGGDLTVAGPAPGALTGFSLASGDIDGDAHADLVIGSFQADGTSGQEGAGLVHVVFGSDDLPPLIDTAQGEADITVSGPAQNAWLGETVTTGDFNGDGLDDLLLTAAFAQTAAGEDAGGQVYVVVSPPATIDLSTEDADFTIYGEGEGDQIGHSSATGDIDGDGLADALLGAVSSDGPSDSIKLAGEAIVIHGSSLQPRIDVAAGDADALAYGTAAADRLGRSVALGDVDGDDLADLILGLPGADSPAPAIIDSGGVYVVYGSASLPTLIDLQRDGEAYFGDTGEGQLANGVEGRPALSTADIDGDGRAEILVSASDAGDIAGAGAAYVLFLATR